MTRGVLYSAYGERAIAECVAGLEVIKRTNPDLKTLVMTDETTAFRHAGAWAVCKVCSDPFGREAKLSCDKISPFDLSLYLDADTRVWFPLTLPFYALESGWEFVCTLSKNQEDKWLDHILDTEQEDTLSSVGFISAQLQGGVFGFRKTPAVQDFFAAWREEFQSGDGEHDQAAMQRALRRCPIRFYIIGREWNGGGIIAHRFGEARRKDGERVLGHHR